MQTGLLQLERAIIKNGYSIIPQDLLVEILKSYHGTMLTFGVLGFDNLKKFRSEEFDVRRQSKDFITIGNETIPVRDVDKFLNTLSRYHIFSIKDESLSNLWKYKEQS